MNERIQILGLDEHLARQLERLTKEEVIYLVRSFFKKKYKKGGLSKTSLKFLDVHTLIEVVLFIVARRKELDEFKEHALQVINALENVKEVDVMSMSEREIKAEFGNKEKYPDIVFIKRAIPRYIGKSRFRGVTRRGTLVSRIINIVKTERERVKHIEKF